MERKRKKSGALGVLFIFAFVLWTILVRFVDVDAIGPLGSSVGFSTLNEYFSNITGVNISLYHITDWLGLVPIFVALGFAVLGLNQWIKRGSVFSVDRSILALGIFYVAVIAAYAFFEVVVINYRPVLIGGDLEVSYPSSTTLLVTCVMPTAAMQLRERIRNPAIGLLLALVSTLFVAFMVIGRLVSGVHWFTDIIGGALLSSGLVLLYSAFASPR